MIGKYSTVIVMAMIFAVGDTAPRKIRRAPETGRWKQPCGTNSETSTTYVDVGATLRADEAIEKLMVPLNVLMETYDEYKLEKYYKIDLEPDHYESNQVPDDKHITVVKKLANAGSEEIVSMLPTFYTDLQKFAVAFEELGQDAINSQDPHKESLIKTESQLLSTLCELSAILEDLALEVPGPTESYTLRPDPKITDHETYRITRTWGVLLKYRAYLEAWKLVLRANSP